VECDGEELEKLELELELELLELLDGGYRRQRDLSRIFFWPQIFG